MRAFADRRAAGRLLGAVLAREEWHSPVVLGLARGGVPVAYEVARVLRAPLGVRVARKIGAPGQPEFGLGAVTADGLPVYDERSLTALGLTADDLSATCERERAEARRRMELYGRDLLSVENRDVIVCDDGLATGVTARAALRDERLRLPRRLVLAAPVCAPASAEELLVHVDDLRCLARPEPFWAVGQFYRDFRQTTDDEVIRLLDAANREPAGR